MIEIFMIVCLSVSVHSIGQISTQYLGNARYVDHFKISESFSFITTHAQYLVLGILS